MQHRVCSIVCQANLLPYKGQGQLYLQRKMKAILSLLMVTMLGCRASADWGYHSPALIPSRWSESYPKCGGNAQSPINIISASAEVKPGLGKFRRSAFDKLPRSMTLKNTGHSVQVDLEDGYTFRDPSIIDGVYKAAQFHLHFGKHGAGGSEHTLNGERFFGELHIVHWNTKYGDFSAAVHQPDGLAVFGFFIKDDYPQDNAAFERIIEQVQDFKVTFDQDKTELKSVFTLETLLPPDLSSFFKYSGSLTTPPCAESVTWFVFEDPIRISSSQGIVLDYLVLASRPSARGGWFLFMYDNYRPIQGLNHRKVYRPPSCSVA